MESSSIRREPDLQAPVAPSPASLEVLPNFILMLGRRVYCDQSFQSDLDVRAKLSQSLNDLNAIASYRIVQPNPKVAVAASGDNFLEAIQASSVLTAETTSPAAMSLTKNGVLFNRKLPP